MQECTQSTETYKGFILEIRLFRFDGKNNWHRECRVYKDGKRIAICKTKKEAKDLITHGYMK